MTTAALRVFLLCLCSALPATAQEDPAAPAMEFVIIKPGTFRMGCSEGDKLCDPEMTGFWKVTRGDKDLLYKLTRATRAPGSYRVVWNGRDDDGKRVRNNIVSLSKQIDITESMQRLQARSSARARPAVSRLREA